MKKFSFVICLFIISTIYFTLSYNTNSLVLANSETNTISNIYENSIELEIIGQGKVLAKPDSAEVFARIEYSDTIEEISKNSTLKIFNNVINSLYTNGLNESDIKRNYFYTYKNNAPSLSNDYITYLDFSISINNLSNLQNVIDIISAQKYLEINSINYELKNSQPTYLECIKLAIKNAQEKAISLLGPENLKINKIIEQNNYYPIVVYREYITDNIENDLNTPLEIIASVMVEFVKN